jgi:hypothetical protein
LNGLLLSVEEVKFFARFEANRLARGDADFSSGPGIAADTGFARADVEDTKAAQLDPLAFGKGTLEGLEYRIDSGLGLIALQAGAFNHLVNNVLFYQGFPPSGEVSVSRLILETFHGIVNVADVP